MSKIAETPLMKQYLEMKKKHPDAILLFRVGDFYETFSEDAIDASRILGITLTRRANGKAMSVELAGFPHHALDTYLPKLVRAGRRVAICEQLEDPKLTKKLVKRGITEIITPGVNTGDRALPENENNFLAAIHFGPRRRGFRHISVGVAFLDITTGEFFCTEGEPAEIDKLLAKLCPKEIIRMRGKRPVYDDNITFKSVVNELDDWVFTLQAASERLLGHFKTASLKGFGLENAEEATVAAGAIFHYLDYTGHSHLSHITQIGMVNPGEFMRLDNFTIRNLELVDSRDSDQSSLYSILNKTVTPMGARMLRNRILFPLLNIDTIRFRQNATEFFFKDTDFRTAVTETLGSLGDIERLAGRVSQRKIAPRELLQLGFALWNTMSLRNTLLNSASEEMRSLGDRIPDCNRAIADINHTVHKDPQSLLTKKGFIADGVDEELDELRSLAGGGSKALNDILQREIANTGIQSLKISSNNNFGYYFEVRNTYKDRVPEHWHRKQTLVNAERYVTDELQEYEEKIKSVEGRMEALEERLYNELLDRLTLDTPLMRAAAAAVGEIDCLQSAATVAEMYNYVRPVVDDSLELSITNGRHPVIERRLPPGEPYIANSILLDPAGRQIMMITGPNMSGKSALLRQTALIALMAQTGQFVPAEAARVGIIDRIFTRVGASDNISAGESTFMVEMSEAATILNNMTDRSLILFDELGRGTSTYDGISIAWSIVEYIHENGNSAPKTLFATHYHELNEMERSFKRIVNYNVSVKEADGKVIFLRKLARGGSEHSFGIHVARLAGIPKSIVRRANQVLEQLEKESPSAANQGGPAVSKADVSGIGTSREGYQLSLFQLDDPLIADIRERLLNLSIDNLTPLQALTTLSDLQALIKGV